MLIRFHWLHLFDQLNQSRPKEVLTIYVFVRSARLKSPRDSKKKNLEKYLALER